MKKLLVAFALASCSHAPPPPDVAPRSADEAAPTLQLPKDTHALREKLDITIDPDADGFSGTADIDVKLDHPRSTIWLHARDLVVQKVLVSEGSAPPLEGTWEQKDPEGVGRIALPKAIAGTIHIAFTWQGKWAKGAAGLYRSTQKGLHYALTQFEATDARRAFPCFDEPSAKIPWEVVLTVPNAAVAISNSPETARVENGAATRIVFSPTPPLPSYLLAFAVGPFDVAVATPIPPNEVRSRPLPLRIVVPKGRAPELKYALAHSGELLSAIEHYVGVSYPFDKLDFIAAPDMNGAMENAGAITFAEQLLLVDENTSSINDKRRFASVVAHELAHQWFGDLVTHAWWDDIWLNESFATWMGSKIVDVWNPQTEGELELSRGMNTAINVDSRAAARAIRQPILTHHDIANAFDGITYQKGGSVLRMFERFIGVEKFQKGVHAYLEAHRFGNATVQDFTSSITTAAGRDVGPAFRSYLDSPGVPALEVSTICAGGAPRLHVKQSRFASHGNQSSEHLWKIPFCARYEANGAIEDTCALIETAEADVPLDACPAWVMPNAHGVGYYRVALGKEDFATLRGKPFAKLETSERLAYASALNGADMHGTLTFAEIIASAQPLLGDPHEAIAKMAFTYFNRAASWLAGTPDESKLATKLRAWLKPVATQLGQAPKNGESFDLNEKRASVLDELDERGHDDITRVALAKRGAAFVASGSVHRDAISPELVTVALEAYVEHDGEAAWNALATLLPNVQDGSLRRQILTALAHAHAPPLVDKTRALTFDAGLRRGEILVALAAQLDQPELRNPTWDWTKSHFDAITTQLGNVDHAGVRLIPLGNHFCDEEHVADFEKFFAPKAPKLPGAPRVLAETLEADRDCMMIRTRQEAEVRAYVAK